MIILEQNTPLGVLVCGFEHSGTTLLTEMLRQHPKLKGGFEGGFLLNPEARDFLTTEPYYTNVKNGWGVSDQDMQDICKSYTWAGVYAKLRDKSAIVQNQSTWLFDKTPMYMQILPEVLERVPNVPCIVLVRDFRALLWSSFKRTGMSLEQWLEERFEVTCEHFLSYAEGWKRAVAKGFGNRLRLIQYEALCMDPCSEAEKVFSFLNLDFHSSYLSFDEAKHEFVYGNQVSSGYVTEYQERLPEYIYRHIMEVMYDYRDWFWHR